MISAVFALGLTLAVQDDLPADLDYGDVFFEESQIRELSLLNLGVGYAAGVSNSFLNLHSIMMNGQVRVWKYLSTGLMGQFVQARLSEAGDEVARLNDAGFIVHYPTPRWGVFSHSQMDFMLGKWNILNLTAIQVDFLIGGGLGLVRKAEDYDGPAKNKLSYLWSIEQRIAFHERAGLSLSGFGHVGGIFLQAGIFANLF